MKRHKIQYLVMMMFASLTATAQNGVNSPYSRYGFGVQADRSMGFNKGMSGVAQGFRSGQIINVANPASYSAVDSVTALFDVGMTLQNGNFEMGNVQHNARNTSLDYAAFHFRATKGLGVAMGILPYTNINYYMTSKSEKLSGNEDILSKYSYKGDGGLHQAFIGAGWEICKPLSVGFNGSFLFGDYQHITTMEFENETNAYSLVRSYDADISTWMVDFGVQFTQPMRKTDKLVIGFNYGLGHNINNRAIRYTETINSSTAVSNGVTSDTLKNAFQLPHTFNVGATYYKGAKLQIGADFELQKWSKCKFPVQDAAGQYTSAKNQLNDKIRISVGCSYTPNPKSTSRLSDRICYKFGGYYSKSYANTDQSIMKTDKPYEFGLSAGVSIPISNRNVYINVPKLNLSVQWAHTNIPYVSTANATPTIGKLTENYLRFCVGLTFSERWFYKYKME